MTRRSQVDRKDPAGRSARRARAYRAANRQLNIGMVFLGLWCALVSFFFLWQALNYRGIVAWLAEWQFYLFNHYWPTLTFGLLTVACSVPMLLVPRAIRARQRRNQRLGPARLDDRRMLIERLDRLQNFFIGVATGCVIAIAVMIVVILRLPSDTAAPRSIVIGSPDAIAPADGRATLTGAVLLGETAQFNQDLLFIKRSIYFAPILAGPKDKNPLRYFVEVRRDDIKPGFDPIKFPDPYRRRHVWRFHVPGIAFTPYLSGVLKRHALPGEIAHLYRHAGYAVDADTYVLFRSNSPIIWRYGVLILEFAIAAALAVLIAVIFVLRQIKLGRSERGATIQA